MRPTMEVHFLGTKNIHLYLLVQLACHVGLTLVLSLTKGQATDYVSCVNEIHWISEFIGRNLKQAAGK